MDNDRRAETRWPEKEMFDKLNNSIEAIPQISGEEIVNRACLLARDRLAGKEIYTYDGIQYVSVRKDSFVLPQDKNKRSFFLLLQGQLFKHLYENEEHRKIYESFPKGTLKTRVTSRKYDTKTEKNKVSRSNQAFLQYKGRRYCIKKKDISRIEDEIEQRMYYVDMLKAEDAAIEACVASLNKIYVTKRSVNDYRRLYAKVKRYCANANRKHIKWVEDCMRNNHYDNHRYKAVDGNPLSSKNEVLIYDMITNFCYFCMLEQPFGGTSVNKNMYYSDFVLFVFEFSGDGEESEEYFKPTCIFNEVVGKPDDQQYVLQFKSKLEMYAKYGLVQGSCLNVIINEFTAGVDCQKLQEVILMMIFGFIPVSPVNF